MRQSQQTVLARHEQTHKAMREVVRRQRCITALNAVYQIPHLRTWVRNTVEEWGIGLRFRATHPFLQVQQRLDELEALRS